MMGILWASLASVAWGSADFFAKLSSERLGASATLFWVQALSVLFLGLLVLFLGAWHAAPWWAWAGAIALGVSNTIAILFLYRSFEVGMLSLVSPIASSYPAVSLLLSLILLHAAWTPMKAGGIALLMGGTLLAALIPPDAPIDARARPVANGVPEALVASMGMGVTMFGLVYVAAPLGSLMATWILRVTATVLLLVAGRRRGIPRPPRDLWAAILVTSLFDTLAFVAYNQSLVGGEVSLAAPISGSFAVVTLVLARLFLKEHLKAHQWLGILAVLTGIVLVSVPQA